MAALDAHSTPDPETFELLRRVRTGDSGAFAALYERYHDELLFAVRAHLGPEMRAFVGSEDVLHSVAVEAFQALPGARLKTPEGLQHRLHAMVVEKIRQRAPVAGETDGEPDGGAPDPDALADPRSVEPVYRDAGRYERLERALAALPAELREVVVLRRIDGLESKEVAALLGRSDDAVRKAYSRAMARLATLLGDDG